MRLTGQLFDPQRGFRPGTLCVEGDTIVSQTMGEDYDLGNCCLIPGLTDLHFHGCAGADASDGGEEALARLADYQLSRGVTQICPAVMALPRAGLLAVCRAAAHHAAHSQARGAELVGLNLEGPFLAPEKRGAQRADWLQKPDLALLADLAAASGGLVKLVTVAPELPGALDFIRGARALCRVSIGHTAADYAAAQAAFEAGAEQVTHLFNAMPPFHHRRPGVIGAAADRPGVVCELIADGVHVHPAAVRAAFRLLGPERVILISDSMRAAGLGDGTYDLGGQTVTVENGRATGPDGALAGSCADLMECLRRAVSFGVPLAHAVTAAAVNPAKALGIYDRFGSLDPGKAANLAVLNEDLTLRAVIFRGEVVHGAL